MTANVIEEVEPTWPRTIREEFEANQLNGRVGTRLLSETDRVRVWEIRLAPGERIGFHRHVLDYFWPGRIRRMAPLSRRPTRRATRVTSCMAQVNTRSMILKTSVIPICGSPLSSFSTVRMSRWKLTPSPILGEILSLPGRGACKHPAFCQNQTRLL